MKKLSQFQIDKKHSQQVKGGADYTGAADTCDTKELPLATDICDKTPFQNSNVIFTQK